MTDNGNKARPVRTLTVKNFSVIKDAKLEFGKITVLIGPQASGKSLLCKLAYFLGREIFFIAEGRIKAGFDYSSLEDAVGRDFEKWFPRAAWGGMDWSVSFSSGDYAVSVSERQGSFTTPLVSFCNRFRDIYERSRGYTYPDSEYFPSYLLRGLAGQGVWDRITYIPSERNYFVDTGKDYKALVSDPEPLVSAFATLYSNARDPKIPKPRMQQCLHGRFEQGEDEWKFSFEDGRSVSLSNLSSGSKGLLPLFCVLEMYEHQRPATKAQINSGIAPEDSYRSDDFFIEEPEGHIFPETQQEVVRYFAELANSVELNTRFTVTTHSPYILSTFNNLIEASQVVTAKPELRDEVAKLIPERYWVKSSDFKAYCIHDGNLESIMDSETGLISGNYLDRVSETIGFEFDELLRLGYVKS